MDLKLRVPLRAGGTCIDHARLWGVLNVVTCASGLLSCVRGVRALLLVAVQYHDMMIPPSRHASRASCVRLNGLPTHRKS